MRVIRWGVLGAANFAREHMAPAIHAASGAEFYALATSSPEKAAPFQAFCPGVTLHDSYEALLADPAVEAVYIPLPNHLHVEWVEKAVAAGKHVLCEKPIALRAAEIDRLIALRDRSGLLVAEAYMILHHPQWIRVRDWIMSGEIGEIVHADTQFSFRLEDLGNIRMKPETAGGSLRDIGVYTFGSVRYATGAEPVAGSLMARLGVENGIDTFAHVFGQMRGDGGAFTYASTTSMRAYRRQCVTIQGTRGMIRVEGGPFNSNVNDMAEVELHQAGNRTILERFPSVNQYKLQVENFGRSVRDGVAYPVPLEFSRGTQAMMDEVFALGSILS